MRRWIVATLVLIVLGGALRWPGPHPPREAGERSAPPRLFPDLAGVTVPPNIAAPGFRVLEPGTAFHAVVEGARGRPVAVGSRRPELALPLRHWRQLLAANQGGALRLRVAVQGESGWQWYRPLELRVATEPIDRYLIHRSLSPLYNWWRDVGVYQRDLTGYRTRLVLHGRQFGSGCVNCHAVNQATGQEASIGFRSETWGLGTLVVSGGRAVRVDHPLGYGSWHPSGRFVAYSLNQVRQFFHTAGEETRDVLDLASDLVCYRVADQTLFTSPDLARKDSLETYPTWSPDGRWLYFARARTSWNAKMEVPPPGYERLRYSLLRVAFDPTTSEFGIPEMLRDGDAAGQSSVFPRVSPDGRWLLYTTCDYSCFPIHRPNSDLRLRDLRTGADRALAINSDRADTWHSWSRDGRWIAFASKRADGLFTKVYLSYFDRDGRAHPPLLLPQQDIGYYDDCWYSYNVPELAAEPYPVNPAVLGRSLRSERRLKPALPAALGPAPGQPADPSAVR